MNRNKVPTSCCDDYGNCNQGRFCPVRIARLTTDDGGKQVDTDHAFTQADALVILGMFSASAIVVVLFDYVGFLLFLGMNMNRFYRIRFEYDFLRRKGYGRILASIKAVIEEFAPLPF